VRQKWEESNALKGMRENQFSFDVLGLQMRRHCERFRPRQLRELENKDQVEEFFRNYDQTAESLKRKVSPRGKWDLSCGAFFPPSLGDAVRGFETGSVRARFCLFPMSGDTGASACLMS